MSFSDTSSFNNFPTLLHRCSTEAQEAATRYHRSRKLHEVPTIVREVIAHYIPEEKSGLMKQKVPHLRLREDLGLDSLSMIEIVMTLEEAFEITLDESELRELQTVGDINRYAESRLSS